MSKYAKYDQIQGLKHIILFVLILKQEMELIMVKIPKFKPNSEIKTLAICSPFTVFQQKDNFLARCDMFVVPVFEISSTVLVYKSY